MRPYAFLSTLSLRRATVVSGRPRLDFRNFYPRSPCGERPHSGGPWPAGYTDFYPRSPCGERQQQKRGGRQNHPFLSTLSLRRATLKNAITAAPQQISIHALLAESDLICDKIAFKVGDFYPRSPCGERRTEYWTKIGNFDISIHALLAESDILHYLLAALTTEFLSTLSLRRAT